ncbi:MAG: hypothetical protein M3503_02850 [Actinomycetota bacterium]|nr:hypothetical protein [Actinomycetota bacterium]
MARDHAEDPADSLAAAQAFVAETGSYRLDITVESHITTGDPGGAGAETTTRAVTTGAVAGPDRWTMATESADVMSAETFTDEVVRLGEDVYVRSSLLAPDAATAGPSWVRLAPEEAFPTLDDVADSLSWVTEDGGPVDGPLLDGLVVETLLGAYLFDVEQDPTSVVRLVEEATAPVVVERLPDGGVRLRVSLEPVAEIAEVVEGALDEELAPVDVLLDVDADGRPVEARFRGELGSASADLAIEFGDWGAAIEVVAPAAGEIDATPWVQEEALRALDAALLVAPTTVPEPLILTDVTVYEGSGEGWDCTSLDLSYDDRAEQDAPPEADLAALPYLSLSVHPAGCWLEDDDAPFDLVLGGHPARETSGFWELEMGEAVVAIDTSLDDEAVDAVAATLGRTSAEALITAAPEPPEGFGGW